MMPTFIKYLYVIPFSPFSISNLVNIISVGFFSIPFTEYARVMIIPDIVAIVSSALVLSELHIELSAISLLSRNCEASIYLDCSSDINCDSPLLK